MCRRSGTNSLDPAAQAARCCALPGFHTGTWTRSRLIRVWMGRDRDYSREGRGGDWARPNEPIEDQGCPAAWYQTDFYLSLSRYYRRRDEHGNRVSNPALDRCDDPLVHEAINALEGFEEHAAYEAAKAARAAAKK